MMMISCMDRRYATEASVVLRERLGYMVVMAFSICAVLKSLVQKFNADLTAEDSCGEPERRCVLVIEAYLLQTATEHTDPLNELDDTFPNFGEDVPDEEISTDILPSSDLLEEAPAPAWTPIESQMSSARMETIWKFDLEKGRKKCLAKFKIRYSKLRAIRRHFTQGTGEHVKYQRIRSHVEAQFKQVDYLLLEIRRPQIEIILD